MICKFYTETSEEHIVKVLVEVLRTQTPNFHFIPYILFKKHYNIFFVATCHH